LSVIQNTLPKKTTDEEKKIRREEDVKARKIIIYSVRDHLLPRISNLKTTYEMYEALKDMFESDNTLRSLTLKGQIQSTKMTKGDTISTFFMKISEIKDHLGAIGEIMSDRELVLSTLNNIPKHWEPFLQSINGREKLPTFYRLWTDCTQEELRLINRGVEDSPDHNHAISLHTNKGGRFKRNFRQTFRYEKTPSASGHNQRRDVSEIQSFRCDKYGHYERNFPTKKKGRQYSSTADIDTEPPYKDEDKRDENYFL
jgi:hypothetical protein